MAQRQIRASCRSQVRRVREFGLACGCAILFAAIPPFATAAPITSGPEPDWVETAKLDLELPVPRNLLRDGAYFLLVDGQSRSGDSEYEKYYRSALYLGSEHAVQAYSQVTIDFDPTYQRLVIHSIGVHRDGRYLEKLDVGAVQVLQREPQLDQQWYQGTNSALFLLEDVRVGDVLDTRYTLRGQSPALEGQLVARFSLASGIPFGRLRQRFLWPAEWAVEYRLHQHASPPRIRRIDGWTECTWNLVDLDPVELEGVFPAWYELYPWAELSSFSSWEDVVSWGRSHYESVDRSLESAGRGSRALDPDANDETERLEEVIRYVQDEIRYLAITLGERSYVPAAAAAVQRRRYGDCKDKALLLISLLREMGVDAWPALVSSSGHRLETQLPSPLAFDHVIVRWVLGDDTLWVDPTIRNQGGSPTGSSLPAYRLALELREGATGLTAIQENPGAERRTTYRHTLRLGAAPDSAELLIESVFEGADADAQRELLSGVGTEELGEGYLAFYESIYPGIQLLEPIEAADDRRENRVSTRERYRIPRFWTDEEEVGRLVGWVYAPEFSRAFLHPGKVGEILPVAVPHPQIREHVTEIHLPTEWTVEEKTVEVRNSALAYVHRVHQEGRRVRWEHRLETFQDHVLPGEIATYVDDLDEIDPLLSWPILWGHGSVSTGYWRGAPWLLLVLLIGIVGGGVYVALGVEGWNSLPPADPAIAWETNGPRAPIPVALLALVAAAGPVLTLFGVASPAAWQLSLAADSNIEPLIFLPLFLAHALLGLVIFLGSFYVLASFLRRERRFPLLLATRGVLVCAWAALHIVLIGFLPEASVRAEGWTAAAVAVAVFELFIVRYGLLHVEGIRQHLRL